MPNIEVTSITTVRRGGADDILINTTLPMGVYPFKGTATVRMEVARGTAEDYVAIHFPGVSHKVIEA